MLEIFKTTAVDLSGREADAVAHYADTQGISLDEAATRLAINAFVARYGKRSMPGARVIRFVGLTNALRERK